MNTRLEHRFQTSDFLAADPYRVARRVVWTCPKNGEPTECQVCGARVSHRCEALGWPPAPICETHRLRLIPAPETRP
jgi:hypothetical protein